jgi:hypothetical protein
MPGDSTRLRYGPYKPPRLRKGDRAFCYFRDCDVVVTAWTDAPLSWPRCRPLRHPGGYGGLLVTEELQRAILSEAAAALKRWFGVSGQTVWQWRRAFGVTYLGTPGSRAVHARLVADSAAVRRGRPLSAAHRRLLRRLGRERNWADRLVGKRWASRGWTKSQETLLGTAPDAVLARRFKRSAEAVRQRRSLLKVPRFEG